MGCLSEILLYGVRHGLQDLRFSYGFLGAWGSRQKSVFPFSCGLRTQRVSWPFFVQGIDNLVMISLVLPGSGGLRAWRVSQLILVHRKHNLANKLAGSPVRVKDLLGLGRGGRRLFVVSTGLACPTRGSECTPVTCYSSNQAQLRCTSDF